jgi:CRISPR-associated endonuclease/helicase Cas3
MDCSKIQFWAKTTADNQPGISVRAHCLNVGYVAAALIEQMLQRVRDLLPRGAATLAALHDVGKISPGFQNKCPAWVILNGLTETAGKEDWANHQTDHALISQWTLQNFFGTSRLSRWAAVVGAHHGRIKGNHLGRLKVGPVGEGNWEEARKKLVADFIEVFGVLPDKPEDREAALWLAAGLITVADWIGSDEEFFSPVGGQNSSARELAESALNAIGWRPAHFQAGQTFSNLFPECNSPRPLQSATLEQISGPGLYLIEAQMGSGKTEAALAATYRLLAAGQATGLYFALPTQVTSNRIYERVAAFLSHADAEPKAGRLRLAHSTSWLLDGTKAPVLRTTSPGDTESGEFMQAGRSWFASSKRALLTPHGVGTIDQALLGVVAAKHFFIRQFGLAGKVVILDEVHSYDLYTGTLLDTLVRRLRELGCTVIILSATLTAARRRELIALTGTPLEDLRNDYPLLTSCPEKGGCQQISFSAEPPRTIKVSHFAGEMNLEEQVIQRAAEGQCVLWVHNTVREAQETFRRMRGHRREGGPPVALLHSRFPQYRREELETEWLRKLGKQATERPAGCVLVATQVVEQSVDIDADYLVTDLAPTDMLLQRLGRLWRHERRRPAGAVAEMLIHISDSLAVVDLERTAARQFQEALGLSGRVYAPYVLLRSLVEWRNRAQIILPTDIRNLLEATYADRQNEPLGWRALRDELEKNKEKLRQLALNNTSIWNQPALTDDEEIQTRFNSRRTAQLLLATQFESNAKGRTKVALLNGTTAEVDDFEWSFPAAKAIHWNLVRVPRYAMKQAMRNAPAWLRLHVFGECALGLVREEMIYWPGSEEPSGLTWHPDEGIVIPRQSKSAAAHKWEDDYESYD